MGWGDELMAAGDARRLMARDQRPVRIVDRWGQQRWHALWEGNPRIVPMGRGGNCQQLINGPGCRPYHTGKRPERWEFNLEYRATPAELYFTPAEIESGRRGVGRIIVEPHLKAKAPPGKQWGWIRWNKLSWLMQRQGFRVTQIGPPDTPLLEGADFIETRSFREACALLATARAAVLPEGGLHHAAAAVGLPAVVIFGGFTPVEVTGYDMHINIGASGSEACGSRIECPHCAKLMASIDPQDVLKHLENILESGDQAGRGRVAACA